MKKIKLIKGIIDNKFFKISLFALVLLFTFILRAHNYDRVPPLGHLEELLYGWSGIYLIETGVPVSWSTLDYPKRAEVYIGDIGFKGGPPHQSVTLYRPWLDEPPLFSLMTGGVAHLNGADRNSLLPTSDIRIPSIILAFLTSLMLFVIGKKLSGFWTGLLAMLIYGTVPIFVFASRLAVPENLIAFFVTVITYLMLKFRESPRFIWLLPIPFLVGIAGLSKPTGYFILPLVLYLVFKKQFLKNKISQALIRNLVFLIIFTIPFVAAFFWYGYHFDKEIFWNIISIQGQRPVGFASLGWFFSSPAFDINFLTDSWYIFGLLALAYFLFNPPTDEKRLVIFIIVYEIIIMMLSGGEADLLPWYRYPFFPLLSLVIVWALQKLVKDYSFFSSFLIIGMLLGNRMLLVNPFHPRTSTQAYRTIFSLSLLPALLYTIFKPKWLRLACQIILIVFIGVGIYINSVYIYNNFDLACEALSCPIGPGNSLSTLHFPIIWRLFALKF
jgi:4-amino-4-deoxy-L-arabinose transferase-like glycosyltransferase